MSNQKINIPTKPSVIKEEGVSAVYEIEGLYPGFGHTLGNTLRRIMLSSIQGSAITEVKINDVSHEFTNIEGLKEDTIIILLNLKRLRLALKTDEPQTITLKKKGVGAVTAGDIKNNSLVTIANKDHYIGEITKPSCELTIEMRVEKGVGFLEKEQSHRNRVPIGTIHLDALFSPVRRINYEVENMRVGNRVDFNRLRLIIESDGSMSPRDIYQNAIDVLQNQVRAISVFREVSDTEKARVTPKNNIKDLGLSNRIQNALEKEDLEYISDIVARTKEELINLPGLGEKAVVEIEQKLQEHNLELAG